MKYYVLISSAIALAACNSTTGTTGGTGGTGNTGGTSGAAAFSSSGYATATSDIMAPGVTFTAQALITTGTINDQGVTTSGISRGDVTLTRAASGDAWEYTGASGKKVTLTTDADFPGIYYAWDDSTNTGTALLLASSSALSAYGISGSGQDLITSGGTAIFGLADGTDNSTFSTTSMNGTVAIGIMGYNTDPADMPGSGTATFNGSGFVAYATDPLPNYYGQFNYAGGAYGPATISADFGNKTIAGDIQLVEFMSLDDYGSINSTVSLSNGKINGNSFSADLVFANLAALNLTAASADLEGHFYEAGGAAVAGTILGNATVDQIMSDSDTDIGNKPAALIGGLLAEK